MKTYTLIFRNKETKNLQVFINFNQTNLNSNNPQKSI